jgi:hypothetical protein
MMPSPATLKTVEEQHGAVFGAMFLQDRYRAGRDRAAIRQTPDLLEAMLVDNECAHEWMPGYRSVRSVECRCWPGYPWSAAA